MSLEGKLPLDHVTGVNPRLLFVAFTTRNRRIITSKHVTFNYQIQSMLLVRMD